MNWNAIGAVGQILGSLATFVTVGFLAVQMHDSEKDAQRAIVQNRAEQDIQFYMALATDERLTALHMKANAALLGEKPSSYPPFYEAATKQLGLTMEEAYSLYAGESAIWDHLAQTFTYEDELPPGDQARFDRFSRNTLSEPTFLFWYKYAKPSLDPTFVRYLDRLLAQPG